jgi:hypothetical protein
MGLAALANSCDVDGWARISVATVIAGKAGSNE